MSKLSTFFESPSNRTGIAAILSVIPGIAAQLLVHNAALSSMIATVCFGLIKIIQPENSVTTTQLAAATNTVPAAPASK